MRHNIRGRYSPRALEAFCRAALEHHGLSAPDAATVTRSLVEAELSGVGPHGMPHLLLNVDKLRKGEAEPRPDITVRKLAPSLFRLDGGRCLGQIAASRSVELALSAAAETGIGFCLAANTHTYGFAAHFVHPIAEKHGYVAATWCNTSAWLAPWGGATPLVGTNPIAVALPTGEEPTVMVDLACSVRSWGDVVEAARASQPIPKGWALDRDGHPTTEATAALDGSLLPFGQYKGFGLALVVEILTGYLAGLAATEPIPQAEGFRRTPLRSHVMFVLDVGRFVDPAVFRRNLDDFLAQIRRSRRVGETAPRAPGALAKVRREEHLARGIALAPALIEQLEQLGTEISVAFPPADMG